MIKEKEKEEDIKNKDSFGEEQMKNKSKSED